MDCQQKELSQAHWSYSIDSSQNTILISTIIAPRDNRRLRAPEEPARKRYLLNLERCAYFWQKGGEPIH